MLGIEGVGVEEENCKSQCFRKENYSALFTRVGNTKFVLQ